LSPRLIQSCRLRRDHRHVALGSNLLTLIQSPFFNLQYTTSFLHTHHSPYTTSLKMTAYYPQNPQNLQFYNSAYSNQPVSGHSTPFQAYNGGAASSSNAYASTGFGTGFASQPGMVSGRMGDQGGLATGWLAAFGTAGYDGEPALLEELGVNFGHIKMKVCHSSSRRLEKY
jgi:hypothetical protein